MITKVNDEFENKTTSYNLCQTISLINCVGVWKMAVEDNLCQEWFVMFCSGHFDVNDARQKLIQILSRILLMKIISMYPVQA